MQFHSLLQVVCARTELQVGILSRIQEYETDRNTWIHQQIICQRFCFFRKPFKSCH